MKTLTIFSVTLLTIAVIVVNGCAPSPTPIATPELPTPTLALPTATAVPPTPVPQGRTLQVASTADSGPGTLRQALLDAQPHDTITFDPAVFPPQAPETIAITSGLPQITQGNLTIDASNAGVIVDGSEITIPEFLHGLNINSNSNTIRGLQIVGFSDAGIALGGGASHNLIGGDRGVGTGPVGQGNLVSGDGSYGIGLWGKRTSHNIIQGNYIGINPDGTETGRHLAEGIFLFEANHNVITDNVVGGNESGIYLCCVADGQNAVAGNIIGTDASGETPLGNHLAGVSIQRTNYNVIGPGNIIAFNDRPGIIFWDDTSYNTVTQNSIYDNGESGISVARASDARRASPLIFDFDLQAGSLTGLACADCIVEVFSDSDDEGAIYEGQTIADSSGFFTFSKGVAFTGPHLTANATDPNGTTTVFSRPTQGVSRIVSLQEGNTLAKLRLQTNLSRDLADNRIGVPFARDLDEVTALAVKRFDLPINELEPPIDWSTGEFVIPPSVDSFVDGLAENGVEVDLILAFWDKAGHAMGEDLSTPRFKTEEQVQDFLDYVRFVVRHFEGRIQYYTLWSEPDNCGGSGLKCIEPVDYINLAKQIIPVIREEDAQAGVVLAPVVLYFGSDWLFTVLRSDVVQLFDVISWHPFYDAAPDIEFFGDYYFNYPSIVRRIKQTASDHGFQGEYWGTDLRWWVTGDPEKPAGQPWESHTGIQSAKYYARVTVMQLGLNVGVGAEGVLWNVPWPYATMPKLNTVMAGTTPTSLSVDIESEATNIVSYGFTLPNGDILFALWTNDAAVDDDPGVSTTLTFPDLSVEKVVGIDVLNGFEQEVITETENGNLVIRNLLVKDYPIILRLID